MTDWQWIGLAVEWGMAAVRLLPPLAELGLGGRLWEEIPICFLTALLQGFLLSPLRLGRLNWYRRLCREGATPPWNALTVGGAGWRNAMEWRWRLWWRTGTELALFLLPGGVALAIAEQTGSAGEGNLSVLWLLLGLLLWLMGGVWVFYRTRRFVLAPFFLLDGFPPGAVLACSAQTMKPHRTAYFLWLWQTGWRWALPWLAPGWRREQTALLEGWYRERQTNPCIFGENGL